MSFNALWVTCHHIVDNGLLPIQCPVFNHMKNCSTRKSVVKQNDLSSVKMMSMNHFIADWLKINSIWICIMRLWKSFQKRSYFTNCLAQSWQIHTHSLVVRVHLSWKTTWIGCCFIQGAVSIRKTVLPGMAIPMLKIRRPNGRLIFNMEITIRR